MLELIVRWLAGLAGLEVIDPKDPKPVTSDYMVAVMQRALDRANANSDAMFHDYEHRIKHLTEEVARLKRELGHN